MLVTHAPRRYYYIHQKPARKFSRAVALLYLVFIMAGGVVLKYSAGSILKPPQKAEALKSVETPAPKAAPAPKPVEPRAPLTNAYLPLEQSIKDWVGSQTRGEWSVVVQDLNSPANRAVVNEGKQYYTASMYKLFLTIPLSQKLPFSDWQKQRPTDDPQGRTYMECVRAMLADSDNDCGEAVGNSIGWPKANQAIRTIGFPRTNIATDDLKSTASDVGAYMEGLYKGQWFDQKTHDFIMDSLALQKYRSGIPAGCFGCKVFNKTGDLNGVTHDAAIVTSGSAKYILVVFSKGGSYGQIAKLAKLINSQITH
jgi:beta-lactamase class A